MSGTAGLIWPGAHVDVILTQSLDDTKVPAARRVAAETVLQEGDLVHVVIREEDLPAAEVVFAAGPEEH